MRPGSENLSTRGLLIGTLAFGHQRMVRSFHGLDWVCELQEARLTGAQVCRELRDFQ